MSDCGVCVYYDDNASYEDFSSERAPTTQEEECQECGKPLPSGTLHIFAQGDFDGEHFEHHVCLICHEIMEAFCCEGITYGGVFWSMPMDDDIWEGLTTACFDKLKTPEAKAELRRRWMEWKGLAA